MERPNIVFVFADQLRYQALGSSGNPLVRTPNLDRLAEQGVVFENAFSCCPVCSPYRGQLLTGRYSHCNGVIDNEYALRPNETTFPQVLKHQGYVTGFVGKWHLGYGPYAEDVRYGFDYMAAYNCNHDYYRLTYHENELGPYPINAWGPEGETDLALRFIDETSTSGNSKPFALFLAWGPPHWPYDRYPREHQIYDPKEVDLPPNVPVQMADFARREIADYYGNVTALDAQMGRLMEHLEERGLSDRTIVCFSSDHGDHLSAHGQGKPMDDWLPPLKRSSKCTSYEESIHIPFILRHPTAAVGGRRTQTLFSSVDVMPTLLGLCDIEIPEGLQGHDLSHAVRGEEGFEPDSVYLQILGPAWPDRTELVGFWRGVRTDRWTYARWWQNQYGPWLFDLRDDPHQMVNLAGKAEFIRVQEQLEARLRQWITETADPFDSGARDAKTGILRLGQRFTNAKWETG